MEECILHLLTFLYSSFGQFMWSFSIYIEGVLTKYRRKVEGDDHESDTEKDSDYLCDRGMTVVNWKHSRMPVLAHALGCGTHEGCPKRYNGKDFDTMWLITFQYTLNLKKNDHHKSIDMKKDAFETETNSLVTLESKSKETTTSLRRSHLGREDHSHVGEWKIKAEMVNEGFYPV